MCYTSVLFLRHSVDYYTLKDIGHIYMTWYNLGLKVGRYAIPTLPRPARNYTAVHFFSEKCHTGVSQGQYGSYCM